MKPGNKSASNTVIAELLMKFEKYDLMNNLAQAPEGITLSILLVRIFISPRINFGKYYPARGQNR